MEMTKEERLKNIRLFQRDNNICRLYATIRKHKKYCLQCKHNDTCKKPEKCPIGNFDEYDK